MPPKEKRMSAGDWAQWVIVALAIIGGAIEAGKIMDKQANCEKKLDALADRFDRFEERFIQTPNMALNPRTNHYTAN